VTRDLSKNEFLMRENCSNSGVIREKMADLPIVSSCDSEFTENVHKNRQSTSGLNINLALKK